MALVLNIEQLGSRVVRSAISSNGPRTFRVNGSNEQKDDDGNIISKIWNGINRFGNSLMSNTLQLLGRGLQITWNAFWGQFTSTLAFLWNFNWNASDAELERQLNSAFNGLAGPLGGTLGNAVGWLACGAIPGAVIATFNEPLGLYVLENVGEEALDELAGNLANLIRVTAQTTIRAATIYMYKNVRKLWREPDSEFVKRLKSQGIVDQAKLDKALAERNKPWSIAKGVENFVESIPNEFLRNFVEEFVEEFFESCTEAGYVVANSLDSYMAAQKLASTGTLGSEQTVEILLNRAADNTSNP